jgi:hypothetical protein
VTVLFVSNQLSFPLNGSYTKLYQEAVHHGFLLHILKHNSLTFVVNWTIDSLLVLEVQQQVQVLEGQHFHALSAGYLFQEN